ncbi:hypothetical protein FRC02_005608, partial [Tulasnella sp. 418]
MCPEYRSSRASMIALALSSDAIDAIVVISYLAVCAYETSCHGVRNAARCVRLTADDSTGNIVVDDQILLFK